MTVAMFTARCCQCGNPLVFDGIHDDMRGPTAAFHCSHCEQQAHVHQDGSGGMTLVNLYPPPMTAQEHWDMAAYQAGEKRMFVQMRVVAGWMTESEYGEWDEKMTQSLQSYMDDHPLPTSLWTRLRERFA